MGCFLGAIPPKYTDLVEQLLKRKEKQKWNTENWAAPG
jgi:hypothetical protein